MTNREAHRAFLLWSITHMERVNWQASLCDDSMLQRIANGENDKSYTYIGHENDGTWIKYSSGTGVTDGRYDTLERLLDTIHTPIGGVYFNSSSQPELFETMKRGIDRGYIRVLKGHVKSLISEEIVMRTRLISCYPEFEAWYNASEEQDHRSTRDHIGVRSLRVFLSQWLRKEIRFEL